jgi:hypothetical protein
MLSIERTSNAFNLKNKFVAFISARTSTSQGREELVLGRVMHLIWRLNEVLPSHMKMKETNGQNTSITM